MSDRQVPFFILKMIYLFLKYRHTMYVSTTSFRSSRDPLARKALRGVAKRRGRQRQRVDRTGLSPQSHKKAVEDRQEAEAAGCERSIGGVLYNPLDQGIGKIHRQIHCAPPPPPTPTHTPYTHTHTHAPTSHPTPSHPTHTDLKHNLKRSSTVSG